MNPDRIFADLKPGDKVTVQFEDGHTWIGRISEYDLDSNGRERLTLRTP